MTREQIERQDMATVVLFLCGFALITLGAAVDHTSVVLAGCAFWWLSKEVGNS